MYSYIFSRKFFYDSHSIQWLKAERGRRLFRYLEIDMFLHKPDLNRIKVINIVFFTSGIMQPWGSTVQKYSKYFYMMYVKNNVYYFYPFQIRLDQCVKLNLNGGQPSKLFWFEASKHLKTTSKLQSIL